MRVPDCLLSPAHGYVIAGLCIVVFIYYCRIASAWLKAARRYNAEGLKNPWLIQAIIFISCGVCGYLTVPLSLVSIPVSAWAKLLCLIVIVVSSELFLKNFALDSIKLAKEANVGKSIFLLDAAVRDGELTKDQALELLSREYAGLQVLLESTETIN